MISYRKTKLSNGLTVIMHEDKHTPMAAINVLYDVGSRDDYAEKTGFAHLMEHLMFTGSSNIPNFDIPLQQAGGDCNAFTSNDITNYYETLPAPNLETALWLESDRMLQLNLTQAALDIQKGVVCEEFKETCLDEPYGNAWHHLRALSYTTHPYRWPVIGKELQHIEQISLADVKQFFATHYCPNKAILSISGGINYNKTLALVEKWFADIPTATPIQRKLIQEPKQEHLRTFTLEAAVPLDAIYMAFHTCNRAGADYYTTDLISEVLAGGSSGRLHHKLVRERPIFSNIYASISGSLDAGLFFIHGKIIKGISIKEAEAAIWEVLTELKTDLMKEEELTKTKNKVESGIAFSELTPESKAFNLAYFELMGNIEEVNNEIEKFIYITPEQMRSIAQKIFTPTNCSIVYYLAKK